MEINKLHQILGALYRDNNNELALELLKEHIETQKEIEEIQKEYEISEEEEMREVHHNAFEAMIAKGLSPEELDKELDKELAKYLGDDLGFDEFEEVEDFDTLDELTSEDYQDIDEEEEYQG